MKTRNYLLALLFAVVTSTLVSADEHVTVIQTALSGTTISGYLNSSISWSAPDPSPSEVVPGPPPRALRGGFYGQSLFLRDAQSSAQGIPCRTHVSVYDTNGKLVKRVISNRVGQFYSFVKPGSYVVLATLPGELLPPRNLGGNLPPSSTPGSPVEGMVQITVNTNQLTQVAVVYYPSE
jgi:hypothetical protein